MLRDGKKENLQVVLEERPESPGAPSVQNQEAPAKWVGLSVEELDPRLSQRLFGTTDEEGVVVTDVEPGSPGDDAGVRSGDVIKEIGSMEINDLRDYGKAVDKYGSKKAVAVLLKRGNQTLYVGVKP